MTDIEKRYILAFDEINALISTSYTLAAGDAQQITDDILSILINAYKLGNQSISEELEQEIEIELEDMELAIYRQIEGETFQERAVAYVNANDLAGLQTLVESEYHRVYNAAAQDGAEYARDVLHLQTTKTWVTMNDDRVRETHRDLEGVSVGVDEKFYTSDGDNALYPGGFGQAENNVNCRCILHYDAK